MEVDKRGFVPCAGVCIFMRILSRCFVVVGSYSMCDRE